MPASILPHGGMVPRQALEVRTPVRTTAKRLESAVIKVAPCAMAAAVSIRSVGSPGSPSSSAARIPMLPVSGISLMPNFNAVWRHSPRGYAKFILPRMANIAISQKLTVANNNTSSPKAVSMISRLRNPIRLSPSTEKISALVSRRTGLLTLDFPFLANGGDYVAHVRH